MTHPPSLDSLWILGVDHTLSPLSAGELPAEHHALQKAHRLVHQALAELGLRPLLEPSADQEQPPAPERQPTEPPCALHDEHELTIALLLLARGLRAQLRPGLLPLGNLDERGGLPRLPEGLLAACARCLDEAPGQVDAVLVSRRRPSLGARSSAEHLEGLRRAQQGQRPRVLGVSDLAEAAGEALGLEELLRNGEVRLPPGSYGLVVGQLWRQALEGPAPLLGWGAVAALASGLLLRGPNDTLLRWQASFARDVARRHQGHAARIPWPDDGILEVFPRDTRLRIVAHLVQSVADGEPSNALDAVEQAAAFLSPAPSRLPADATLLGAMGRALAAAGEHERAESTLGQAQAIWEALDQRESSSYALCERLRLLGLLGRGEGVDALVAGPVKAFLQAPPEASPSHPFVRLSAGRALAQAGHPHQALALLAPELWASAPEHVQTSRLRWLAFALRASGDDAQAGDALAALESHGDTDQLHLARLDEALAKATDWRPHAQALLDAPEGGEEASLQARRLSEHTGPDLLQDRQLWARLAREYRY